VYGEYTAARSNDGSQWIGWQVGGSTSLTPRISTRAYYFTKRYSSSLNPLRFTSERVSIGGTYQINSFAKFIGDVGFVKARSESEGSSNARNDIDALLEFRVSKVQTTTVGYLTELQDFNGQLLSQNLNTSHIVVKNSMFWKLIGIGSYTELYRSYFSDQNTRNLVFTSLYKAFNTKHPLKAGINYLNISFAEQRPLNYFSPANYQQVELFSSIGYTTSVFPIGVTLDLAGGIQNVDGEYQRTWRAKLSVNKEIGRLKMAVSAAHSTMAVNQSIGFSYSQLIGRITIRLSDTPIFKRPSAQ